MMNDLKDFIVPFSSLKNGSNHLTFDLDKKFFEAFDFSEVNDSKISAIVDFRKESNLFDLRIEWSGNYQTICDRCIGELSIKSNEKFRRIVKFSHEKHPKTTSEIILISYDSYELDLAPLLLEEFILIFPKRKIHKNSSCDSIQINTVNSYIINGTESIEFKTIDEDYDPRWDALKKLKNKDE